MPRAIECKYHGPTDRKGSRYSAYDHGTGQRVILSADYSLNYEGNCWRAAEALLAKLDWAHLPRWNGATTRTGYVFVPSDDRHGQAWTREPIDT